MSSLIWIGTGFLVGSIPFGLIFTKIFHGRDIRLDGSGNIGTTNVSRVVGFWPAGALTLFFDVLKSAMPLLILKYPDLFGTSVDLDPAMLWWVGLATMLGHCFSPWLKFRGGKGVATGLGVVLALSPWAALAGAIGFVLGFFSTRVGSVGSLTGVWLCLVTHWAVVGEHALLLLAMVLLITLRHASNLQRLLEDRENHF